MLLKQLPRELIMTIDISILIPVLNEEETVPAMLERFTELSQRHDQYNLEFVIVDDGSTDRTVEKIRSLAPNTLSIQLISLSRNFGSHAAISAGFEGCLGKCAIILGADLQEPPELVDQFIERFEQGDEVVWGIRNNRTVGGLGGLVSRAFSFLFHRYSDIKSYPAEGPSGFLVTRNVIDVVVTMPERHRNVLGLIAWAGFRQSRVNYNQEARFAGESKWTRKRLLKLAVDSFVQFSSAPIRAMSYIGAMTAVLGFIYAFIIAIRALFSDWGPTGWATVTVLILVLGGIQLLMLGVLGEYIWRGVDETRSRPLFVIRSRETLTSTDAPQHSDTTNDSISSNS